MSTTESAPSQDSLYGYSSFYLAHVVIDFILGTSAFLSNAFLLITIFQDFRHHNQLWRTPVTLLVVNLSMCDLLTGIVPGYGSFYFDLTILLTRNTEQMLGFKLMITVFAIITNVVGSCTVVAMSFDRLIAVKSPLRYKTVITKKKFKIFIVSVWIYALFFASFSGIGVPNDVFILLYCHLHVSLPLIILAVVFWKTYHSLRLHNNRVGAMNGDSGGQMNEAHRRRERKVLSAIQFVLGLFYITFMPQFVSLNISFFYPWLTKKIWFKAFLYTANKVLLVNSSVNPFFYAWRIPKYKRALKMVFTRQADRPDTLSTGTADSRPVALSADTADRPVTLLPGRTDSFVLLSTGTTDRPVTLSTDTTNKPVTLSTG